MDPLEQLFLRFRQSGDPEALAQVFDRAAPRLLALALQLCSNPADAEDALQATFVTAIDRADSYDAARPLQAWLGGILTLRCKQLHERRARRRESELTETATDTSSPPVEAERRELVAMLRQRVERLPEEQRQVLLLQLQHGLTPVEIGEVLGVLPGTVRMRIHRGLQALRRLLPAGLAAWLWAMFPGRGLAAVRQSVLAHTGAPSATAVALGSALVMKRAMLAVVVVMLALLGWSLWPESSASRANATSSAAVKGEHIASPSTPAADGALAQRSVVAGPPADAPANLTVNVVRSSDGTGVAQVSIDVERDGEDPRFHVRRAVTGADGRVHFAGLPAGNARVRLDRERLDRGMVDHQAEVSVQLASGAEVELRCELPPGATARGRVVDPEGTPVPFAELWLDRNNGLAHATTVGTTDSFGEFELRELPASSYLSARHRDFACSWALPVRSEQLVLRLLARSATVRGTVLGPAGPVADALVTLVETGLQYEHLEPDGTRCRRWPWHSARTDAHGCFTAPSLGAGTVELHAHANGLQPHAETLQTVAGETTTVTVRLAAGVVIRGKVRAPSGKAIAGAAVHCQGFTPFESGSSRTAADGAFLLTTLNPARMRLSVSAHGHRPYEEVRRATAGTTVDWNVTLQPQVELNGRLLDEQRQPLAAWQVRATAAYERYETTDEDGSFTVTQHGDDPLDLWLAQPQSNVWFRCDWLTELPVDRPFEVVVPAQRLPRSFVHGRVLAHDGTPWQGAVSVNCERDGSFALGVSVTTGELSAGPLAEGDYRLGFTNLDGQPGGDAVKVHAVHDRTTEIGEIRLGPTGRLEVRLRRSDGEPLRAPFLFLHHGTREHQVQLRDDGRGMAVLPAGDYEYHLLANNARWVRGRVTVAPGAVTEQDITAGPATRRWVSLPVPLPAGWVAPQQSQLVLFDPEGNEYQRIDCDGRNPTPYRFKPALWPGVFRVELTTDVGARYAGSFTVDDLAESAVPILVALQPAR